MQLKVVWGLTDCIYLTERGHALVWFLISLIQRELAWERNFEVNKFEAGRQAGRQAGK